MVELVRRRGRGAVAMGLAGWLSVLMAAGQVVPLTDGPGNDTEAVWSPDGSRVAFQSDRRGMPGLYVLDVATRRVTPLVEGPGLAQFPAWSPDGKSIVYSYAHFTKTAWEGQPDGYNLFLVPASGGTPRRLTAGLHHDSCPQFSRDGRCVWFSSDRGVGKGENAVSLFSVPLEGGAPTLLLRQTGRDRAVVQPSFSPDGRWVALGRLGGFRDNWHVCLTRADRLDNGYLLTDAQGAFYAPRWSPTGTLLACTGFQPGDAGWNVYLLDARTSARQRIDCGAGNSRSPAWSPDGRQLVFENNRSGQYKLYRISVPGFAPPASPPDATAATGVVLHYSFAERPGKTVADQSPAGNAGQVLGQPEWRAGAVRMGVPGSSIATAAAKGFDFGTGAFAVCATVKLATECDGLAMIATGEYPGNPLGWQLYVGKGGFVYFNSRTVTLTYCGARSEAPLVLGRPVSLMGVRDATGAVQLYVDGVLQRHIGAAADYDYPQPKQVRIGTDRTGKAAFPGWIYAVRVLARLPTADELRGDALARWWAAD
jgi:Tol biopolymer transport system component